MDYEPYERTLSPRPRSQLSSEYSGASTAHPVEWQDEWIHREEEFRDTINALQNEQERIQKKTFTAWINSHVEQHRDKYTVRDLFTDLKDGRILLALIESLTGDHLPCETFRNYTRAHFLSNVERALDYLRDRKIKLVNINSSDIVDGNETVILGLIWTIILNFQIDQDLAHLRENFLISPVPSGTQSASYDARSRSASPSPTKKQRVTAGRGRFQAGASRVMLKWCQKEISDRFGIPILNLGSSWKDGMAFLGLVKVLDPKLVNLNDFRSASPAQRMNAAFSLAQERLGIPKFLDVADIDVDRPDERSIMTYIAQFIKRFPEAKRNRQKMAVENLPDVDAIEANERIEYERIRDWCLDVLTVLKCLELTMDRPFEAYEEYKRFQQNFRTNIHAFARLKEQYEEGRTFHLTEANITEMDSLFSRVISEKLIWHRHLFELLQGHERNLCHRCERIESELDQRVILPPQKVSHYSKGNLEFRVQKHEDAFTALIQLRSDIDQYLAHDYPTEVFAWHDLPGDVQTLLTQLEHRLLSERCKLIIRRQLTIIDEWERRIAKWQDYLKPPGQNVDRLGQEFQLHVVEEHIFDQFLDLSKQLQTCLERLQDDVAADRQQRAAFLSTAVNSNRRWKRICEELHSVREEFRRLQVVQKKKVGRLDVEGYSGATPTVSMTAASPTSPPPLYMKSERWSLYLQMVAAFNRWLDRMERDFESIDRHDVDRNEYHQGLQRFRALCNEVVEHKSDGQDIIDTFYTCSSDLPPPVVAEETRKINRLIRRYDALIPSLEVVRSEVEQSVIHSHQIVDTHRETFQLVPDRPESSQDPLLRVRSPAGGALSPTISLATSGYATPEFENALLRRSEPTTPSESFNRSPPFAYGVSSQSSMNEGSPTEPVFVRDIDIDMADEAARQRPVSPSPRDVAAQRSFVRDVPIREESRPGGVGGGRPTSSTGSSSRPRVAFRDQAAEDSGSDHATEEKSAATAPKRMKASMASSSTTRARATERFSKTAGEENSSASSVGLRTGIVPVNFDRNKIQSLRAAFESPSDPTEKTPDTGKFTATKKFGIFDTLRRKSRSSSESSSDSDKGEKKSGEASFERMKKVKSDLSATATPMASGRQNTGESSETARQRPGRVLFDSSVTDRNVAEALEGPSSSSTASGDGRKRYLRNVNTTTLVTSTETKTVKTVTMVKRPDEDKSEGSPARAVGKLVKPAVFTTGETTVRNVEETRTTVGKLKKPEVFSGSPVPSSSGSAGIVSEPVTPSDDVPLGMGRVKAHLAELRKRQGSTTEESDTADVRSPAFKKPETLPLGMDEADRERSSSKGLKKIKTNTTTEYEETTQTVKRTILSPILAERRVLDPVQTEEVRSTRTVVRDLDVAPRRLDFDEGIQPPSTSSGYQQNVVIAPYGTPRTTDQPETPKKVNRMTDLFEKGKDDPTLFVEQIPEARPSYEYVTSTSPQSHVTSTEPIQLCVEREETYVYQSSVSPVPLTQPVSQRIQSFEEIFAPLSTDVPKFHSPTERRPINPNFSVFAAEQFTKEIQTPPATTPSEVEQETVVRSVTEEDKGKKKGLFGGIFGGKSKKVAPTVTEQETSRVVVQPTTVVRNVEKEWEPRSRGEIPRIHHHVGGSDRLELWEERRRNVSLPSDVREFLGDTEDTTAPLGSSEHFREIIRRLSQGEDVQQVVMAPPTHVVSPISIPDVYLRETTTTVVRPDVEPARHPRSQAEVAHFVPMSDRAFETSVSERHPSRHVVEEETVTTTPVHGRIKQFENIQEVSHSKSTEELSSPTARPTKGKQSAFAQWTAREEQAMTSKTEEKPAKKSVLETLGIRNKVRPLTERFDVEERTPSYPLSPPPAVPSDPNATFVREAPTEFMDVVREAPTNWRCVYPLDDGNLAEREELESARERFRVDEQITHREQFGDRDVEECFTCKREMREEEDSGARGSMSSVERFRLDEIRHHAQFGGRDGECLSCRRQREALEEREEPGALTPRERFRLDEIAHRVHGDDHDVECFRCAQNIREPIEQSELVQSRERFRLDEIRHHEHFSDRDIECFTCRTERAFPRVAHPRPLSGAGDEFITSPQPFDGSPVMSETVRTGSPSQTFVRDVAPGYEDERTFVRSPLTEETLFETVTVVRRPTPEEMEQGDAPILVRDITELVTVPRPGDRRSKEYPGEERQSPEILEETTYRHRGPTVEHRIGERDTSDVREGTRRRSPSPPSKYQKTKFESVTSEESARSRASVKSEDVTREEIPRGRRVETPDRETFHETVVRSRTPDRDLSTESAVTSQPVRGVAALRDRLAAIRTHPSEELSEAIPSAEYLQETVIESRLRPEEVEHHVGVSDRLVEQLEAREGVHREVPQPIPVVQEKVTFVRDATSPTRRPRTAESLSEQVTRSRSKSPSDDLSDSPRPAKHRVVTTTYPDQPEFVETVTRVRSPSPEGGKPRTVRVREHSVEKRRYPSSSGNFETVTRSKSPASIGDAFVRQESVTRIPVEDAGRDVLEETVTRVRSPSPDTERTIITKSRSREEFSESVVRAESPELEVEEGNSPSTSSRGASPTARPGYQRTDSSLSGQSSSKEIKVSERTSRYAKPRPSRTIHRVSYSDRDLTDHVTSVLTRKASREAAEDVIVMDEVPMAAPVRTAQREILTIVGSEREYRPKAVPQFATREVEFYGVQPVRSSFPVEEEMEFQRSRPVGVQHLVGLSDRDVEVLAPPSRPVLVASMSETDLAPKRRSSAFRMETSQSTESTEGQQYPWQTSTTTTPTTTPTVVEQEETVTQHVTPLSEAFPRASTSSIRQTTVEEIDSTQPSTSARKGSSSSSDSRSTSSSQKKEKKEKKKGFFGLFRSSKEKKREKEARRVSETVVTSSSTSRTAPEDHVDTSSVLTSAQIRERAQRDTVGELIHGSKTETVVRSVEPVVFAETPRERPVEGIFHRPSAKDTDVETVVVSHRTIPEVTTETVVRPAPLESGGITQVETVTTTTTEYPLREDTASPSRSTKTQPSFFGFERRTSSKRRSQKSSTGSRKSTPSPAPSGGGGSIDEELRRTASPSFGASEEYSESVRSRSTQSRDDKVIKHKEIHIETKRVPSGEREPTRSSEVLEEDVSYTRPASSLAKKEKYEAVEIVRSHGGEGESYQRTESPMPAVVRTPEPTHEVEFTETHVRLPVAAVIEPEVSRGVVIEETPRERPETVIHRVGLTDADLQSTFLPQLPARPVESLRETVTTVTTVEEPVIAAAVTREARIEEISRNRPGMVSHSVGLADGAVESSYRARPVEELEETVTTLRTVPEVSQEDVMEVIPRDRPERVIHHVRLTDEGVEAGVRVRPTALQSESLREDVTVTTTAVREPVLQPVVTREVSVEEIARNRPETIEHRVGLVDDFLERSTVGRPIPPSSESHRETVTTVRTVGGPITESEVVMREVPRTRPDKVVPVVTPVYLPSKVAVSPVESLRETVTTVTTTRDPVLESPVMMEEIPRNRPDFVSHRTGLSDEQLERSLSVTSTVPVAERLVETVIVRETLQVREATSVEREEFMEPRERGAGVFHRASAGDAEIESHLSVRTPALLPSSSSGSSVEETTTVETVTTTTVQSPEEPVKSSKTKKPFIFGSIFGGKKSVTSSSSTVTQKEVEEPATVLVGSSSVTREQKQPEVEISKTAKVKVVPEETATVVREVIREQSFPVEQIQEEVLIPRERPGAVHHFVGVSDYAFLSMLPSSAPIPEPEVVISQERVVVTTSPEKPVVKPRLAKKLSATQLVDESTVRQEVVVLEELEPRPRIGGVVHRTHTSDAEVEPVAVRPRPMSQASLEELEEIRVSAAKPGDIQTAVVRETETVVVREETAAPIFSSTETMPKEKKSKSGGLFGIFKRKGSKDSYEVTSESTSQQSVSETTKKEKYVPTTSSTVVRDVIEETDERPAVVVVEKVEPRSRTGEFISVTHHGHFSDSDVNPSSRTRFSENFPESTVEREFETVVVSEIADSFIPHGALQFRPDIYTSEEPIGTPDWSRVQEMTRYRPDVTIPDEPIGTPNWSLVQETTRYRPDVTLPDEPIGTPDWSKVQETTRYRPDVTILDEPIGTPDWKILKESVFIQREPTGPPRDRPETVTHFTSVGDRDVEDVTSRLSRTREPVTVVQERESVTTVVNVPVVEEVRTKQPIKKTVSFDRAAEATTSQETVTQVQTVEMVEEVATSSTKKTKTEKSKSKGLFGLFKSGSRSSAPDEKSTTIIRESAPEPPPVSVVQTIATPVDLHEEPVLPPRQRPTLAFEPRGGPSDQETSYFISRIYRERRSLEEMEDESEEERFPDGFPGVPEPEREVVVIQETVVQSLSPAGEERVAHGMAAMRERLTEIRSHRERETPFVEEREENVTVTEIRPATIVEPPRERWTTVVAHHEHLPDSAVEPGLTRVRQEVIQEPDWPDRRDEEFLRESVTTITTINRPVVEEEPTVVFGISEAPRVSRGVVEVERGPAVVSARTVTAQPVEEEFVTTREVVGTTTVKEKKPKGASILKKQTSSTVFVTLPPPTDVDIVEEEILEPRDRPSAVKHRTGAWSDLLVTDHAVRRQREEEYVEERVSTTPTKKAARVIVSSSSSSGSESELSINTVPVMKAHPATSPVPPVIDYSEVVVHTRDRRSPSPPAGEFYDESTVIRVIPPSPTQLGRTRPEPIHHHVGISDLDNEQYMQSTSAGESMVPPPKTHKSLERLVTTSSTSSRPVVMTTYDIDEPAVSEEEKSREDLRESVTVVREDRPLATQSQKTKEPVKTKLTGSALEAGRYRAPEAAAMESLDESIRVFDTEPDSDLVAQRKISKGVKTRGTAETACTVVREAEAVMYTEEKKPKKVRPSRRDSDPSASSDSSMSGEDSTTKKRKAPKPPVKSRSETLITREEYEKKTPVAAVMPETLVRDVYPEPASTSRIRTVSPISATTSETITTASVSQTGSRSKSPDSGAIKQSKMRTTKVKVGRGTPGPSTGSKDGEYSYEDVIYWKTPKTKSPEPDHTRSATIDTVTRSAQVVSPTARSASLAYGARSRDTAESSQVTTSPPTETMVRESSSTSTKQKSDRETGLWRQKIVESTEKSGKGKSVVKKTRSNRSSSSSSSSKEDVDEISSVTLTKAKLTSPTPEPRDEVQMVLQEMKAKKEPATIVHEEHQETSVRRRTGSSLSSTDTEDEQGRRVRRKRTRVRTQPQVVESTKERIVSRTVGQRDSETGVAMIERSSTEQLPSYISFGTIEPDVLQSPHVDIESREFLESERRPRIVTKLHHSAGPKDERIETSQIIHTVVGVPETPVKPIRTDRVSSSSHLHEQVTVLSTPEARIHVSHRVPSPVESTTLLESTTSRTRQTGPLSTEMVAESTRQATTTVVRDFDKENESRLKARESEVERTQEAQTVRLAPSRARSAMSGTASSTTSRPSSVTSEHLEEAVDVYRVKFAKELENQRPKTPNLYLGHEDLTMRTVSTHEEDVNGTTSATSSPAPLGLPYPETHRQGRNFEAEGGYETVGYSSERLGVAKPTVQTRVEETVLKTSETPASTPLPMEKSKTHVLTTTDSVEASLVVEDFRRAALASPDVGDMEYWTTSGGSSDNLDEHPGMDKQSAILNRRSQVSETPTYESIPPREKPVRTGKARKISTAKEESSTIESQTTTAIYSEVAKTRKGVSTTLPPDGGSSSRITAVTSPVSAIETRGFDSRATAPTYAKIQKKRGETLEEDVFYWKILNRRKNKAYSAERLRARSPENNLTTDELAVLAQSVNSIGERKSRRTQTTTKSGQRRTSSATGVVSPVFDDSGAYSANEASRETYNVDLRLTSTLDAGTASESSSLGRRPKLAKSSPLTSEKRLTLPTNLSLDSPTPMQSRSFSPSSNDPLSERESPYGTGGRSSSIGYVDDRSGSSTPQGVRRAKARSRLISDVELETTERLVTDEADRRYRVAMKEPIPDGHSCLPAYNTLYGVVKDQLTELNDLVLDPDCQYIDQHILREERHRFTGLLDGLVRINRELDRLDDLYRAMINVGPDFNVFETEKCQRELNKLYMDLLGHLKCILRRIKHLENLLDEYRRKRLHFKVHLLEELTYFRTHEEMTEDDQRERVNRLLDEVLQLRAATFGMFVRSTPRFAQQLEEELHEILMLLRTELRVSTEFDSASHGSIIQLLLTGKYSMDFDATQQRLILASDDITDELAATTSRLNNPTVWGVVRRALPMQALALILLGFASLIPMTDDEFSCIFSNYFASSFNPALKFSGPPPI